MSYTINLTNGNVFAVIPDGTINQSSSQTLVGRNYAGYGQFLDDNFIHLLENGANSTPPGAPLTGQLWFNTTTGVLEIYNGSSFKSIGGSQAASSPPSNNAVGDLWYDTVNSQLNVWTGSTWLLVGPIYNSNTGVTGAIPGTVIDNTSTARTVIELYVANVIVGFISTAASFTPQTPISGFTTIRPGITLSTLVGAQVPLFQGTATNSQQFNGLSSTQFMRSDSNTSTSGTISILSNNGIAVGSNGDFGVTVSGTTVRLNNNDNNGNITINANVGGTPTAVISVNGATGLVTIPNLSGNFITNGGNITVGNIFNANGNGLGNIGNSSSYFNTLFAKATSAQYADVAERFYADAEYLPGTVVELGGVAEITCAMDELSDTVFGVISTNAAYLMNAGAGTDVTHPPVAMTGRVPVRVIGKINKGDRLVSAGNGLARSALPNEATAFTVFGRSLVNKLDSGVGTIEAIVSTK
jgi:hypothetical protein